MAYHSGLPVHFNALVDAALDMQAPDRLVPASSVQQCSGVTCDT